jgi:hypothetical protein
MSMNQRILQCFDLQTHFHEAGLLNVRGNKAIRCHCDMIQLLEKRDQLALVCILIPMKHRVDASVSSALLDLTCSVCCCVSPQATRNSGSKRMEEHEISVAGPTGVGSVIHLASSTRFRQTTSLCEWVLGNRPRSEAELPALQQASTQLWNPELSEVPI